jgi:hypothetical protein
VDILEFGSSQMNLFHFRLKPIPIAICGLLLGVILLFGWHFWNVSPRVAIRSPEGGVAIGGNVTSSTIVIPAADSEAFPPPAPKEIVTYVSPSPYRDPVQIIISALLLVVSLFVILSKKYGPKEQHWAFATIGTLIGFWFKS